MHPNEMLLEIVQSRPILLSLWTIGCETSIGPSMTRIDFVHGLLVSNSVVYCSEAFLRPWTIIPAALVRTIMPCLVFPGTC